MTTSTTAPKSFQASLSSPARKPLSCTSCRQRKIRCNREEPCDPCLKSGTKCVFPARRTRASRGRPEGVESRDAELLERIRRLEAMLAEKVERAPTGLDNGGSSSNKSSAIVMPLPGGGQSGQDGVTVDDHFADFVKLQSNSSRHLSGEFWSSLSTEFDYLRDLIHGNVDTEDERDDSKIAHDTEEAYSSSNLVFQDADSFAEMQTAYPSKAQHDILFQFYFSNVDPICKILHRPIVDTYFSNLEQLMDPLTRRFKFRSLEAVAFAACFAAIVSMSPQECFTHLREQKDVLVARYKRNTEAALVHADFLSTLEITTLQAFTIYIVAQLSLDRGRHTWTLIGLALRIAHGMGLDGDGDGRAFNAFEAEMRRRLWWYILALDMRASEARGSDATAEISFSTVMPCNLNDEDFKLDSQHPLQSKSCPTEMTICLLGMDALWTSRKVSFRSPTDVTREEKAEFVKEFVNRIKSTYLANCDFADKKMKFLRVISQYWIYRLLLNLHYPVQQSMASRGHCSAQGLHMAISFLNASQLIEQHPSSACLAWHFKAYVPWHAVAVVLAELITQPEGALADRAWEIIESRFQDWNSRVADVKEEMLWGLIKDLLKRARAARQQSQQVSRPTELSSSDLYPSQPSVGEQGTPSTFIGAGFDNFELFDPVTGQPLDFLSFDTITQDTMDTGLNDTPSNIDNWNDFAFDLNALGGEFRVIPGPHGI